MGFYPSLEYNRSYLNAFDKRHLMHLSRKNAHIRNVEWPFEYSFLDMEIRLCNYDACLYSSSYNSNTFKNSKRSTRSTSKRNRVD